MGYLSLSKAAAETALDGSEILLIVSGLVLAFGAIGEYLLDHERKLPRWIRWPKLAFILMVVVSLIGEFSGDAGVFFFSRQLQAISDGEYAALNKEAGDAPARKREPPQNELERPQRTLLMLITEQPIRKLPI
jgi:hypothetical protein